jgi:hypothetical protein
MLRADCGRTAPTCVPFTIVTSKLVCARELFAISACVCLYVSTLPTAQRLPMPCCRLKVGSMTPDPVDQGCMLVKWCPSGKSAHRHHVRASGGMLHRKVRRECFDRHSIHPCHDVYSSMCIYVFTYVFRYACMLCDLHVSLKALWYLCTQRTNMPTHAQTLPPPPPPPLSHIHTTVYMSFLYLCKIYTCDFHAFVWLPFHS